MFPNRRPGMKPRMAPRTWWTLLRSLSVSVVKRFLEHQSPHLAASISYRVLFSLFPLAIVLVVVFGIVTRATGIQADVVDELIEQLPLTEEGRDDLRDLLLGATADTGAVGILGILGIVWAASGMMGATRAAVNLAWGVEQRRNFFRGKALDLVLVLAASLVVLLSVALTVAFGAAESVTETIFDRLGVGALATAVVWVLGTLVPFLLALALFTAAYRILPALKPPFRQIVPAALFVAVVFTVFQQLFALYLDHFADYDAVYGSLGAVIAFLLFVYFSAMLFLLGVHLARIWPEELERARAAEA
jgi:membrane protein